MGYKAASRRLTKAALGPDVIYKPAMPHGDLEQVFDGVYFVTGTTSPVFMGIAWQYSRNMTVVDNGGELTLINTVRLDEAGLAKLDALGRVKHVVKLGAMHGMDDAFYVDRYGATQWGLPNMTHDSGRPSDRELVVGGDMPFPFVSLFTYETASLPEGLLVIDRDGGILVSCDSLQNWATVDRFFSEDSAARMTGYGFIQPANVGPGWMQQCRPEAADFARIKQLPFRHLLSAHGTPLRDHAKQQLAATFERLFGV